MPRITSTPRNDISTGPLAHQRHESSSRSQASSDTHMTSVDPQSSQSTDSTASSRQQAAPSSLTGNALRPDKGGTIGRRTQVTANFFPVKLVWGELSKVADFTMDHLNTVFDGKCNAFAVNELHSLGPARARTFKIEVNEGGKSKPGANGFTVKINFAAVINLRELQLFLDRQGPFTSNCSTAIQALNIAVTHKAYASMVSVGRSVYLPRNAQDLGGGIEKWDGIFQSIRPGERSCFINVDTTATAFIKGGNAAEVFGDIIKSNDLRRRIDRHEITKLERVLKGCTFSIDRGSFQKNYKVTRLSERGADATTFEMTDNDGRVSKISVDEYFMKQYNRRLRYPSLPCIGTKGRNGTNYFPAELCNIKPGQHFKKKLDEEQTTKMIRSTAIRPHERMAKIRESLRILDFGNNQYLKSFGIQISSEMAVVPARILPAPAIAFSAGKERPNLGSWQVGRGHWKGSRLDSWAVLCYERENRASFETIMNFMRRLMGVLMDAGVRVSSPKAPVIYANQHGDIGREVDSIRHRAEREFNRPLQLLIVLFPNKSALYPAIKTYCETQRVGLMTQCAIMKHILKPNDNYCRMIGLKINTKLGGIVSTLEPNSMPFMDKKSTLIIGADVTHPGAGEDSDKPSIASVVASIDDVGSRFIGRIIVQDPRMEVIHELQPVIKDIIKSFKRITGHHPRRILFYRDGVSEGQFESILNTEVKSIKQACKELGDDYSPPITFVVVKKRHHARFFPNRNEQDRSGNCIPGTVIDTMITHPTEFAFYLQSHSGIQGTSRSTLYHVLLDENSFTSDSLQQLTFNLCHMYCRCTKSISIVPAVQYAHMLAFRGRYYVDNGVLPNGIGKDSQSSSRSGPKTGEIKISETLMNEMFFI
ncbi:Eukaryotic translation initiation factor 2C [Entomortierella beljakovae]|nr:Eukaryotic translation initiation factor 2C [Entomortierella beljakovae]